MSVLIVTSLGDIVVDLHADKCPLTAKNFLKLCKIKYYNGCLFHTVQKDFTAQTGDPTGTGTGGDSIYKYLYGDQARFFSDEIHLDLKHNKTGTVVMASAGENLNASQFYFTLRDDLEYLDGKHTVFGEVAEGLDTLARINESYIDEKGRPYKNIRIKHTYILDDPFDDPSQLAELIPGASPEGKPKDEVDDDVRLEDDWVPMDEQLSTVELEEVIRSKAAHSSAVVLESIGDIPDAEVKPPENVLFVCKLNPVTEDEDLHTIFSRFGTVVSADIIRDFKTGDSLCYAFIEFETNEACQEAYFKMDNALIDDRRIHVDFSQSVARLWSQYRRKSNQMGKGNGCFKCGALDHIAKDCTGNPDAKQPSKYILKDDNRQRGGDNNSRYEMVFDDTLKSPTRESRHNEGSPDELLEKQNQSRQIMGEEKHRSDAKDSRDSNRRSDRTRGYRGEEMNRGVHGSHGNRREKVYDGRQIDVEKHRERQRGSDDHKREEDHKRDERDYRKKGADIDGHRDKRGSEDYRKRTGDTVNRATRRDEGEYRKKNSDNDRQVERRDDRDYRKRSADYISHGSGRDDRHYRSRNTDSDKCDRRDTRDVPSHRKISKDDVDYRSQREERRQKDC